MSHSDSNSKLVHIHPGELHFLFELKKRISCNIQLANNSRHYVAFKVKTTHPKKYCVQPNNGILMPKSTSDVTVTMEAQQAAPPDMLCGDKFLIQSTIVLSITTKQDITEEMFSKDEGNYIEEQKLLVCLLSLPISPIKVVKEGLLCRAFRPQNGRLEDRVSHESAPELKDQNAAFNKWPPFGLKLKME